MKNDNKYFALLTYGNMQETICGDKDGPLRVTVGPFDSPEQMLREVNARRNIHLTEVDHFEGKLMPGELMKQIRPAKEPEETWEHA